MSILKPTTGAPGASDNLRTWETIACGGIPVFVKQECRPR
jgi:hypothetical protein